MIPKEGTASKPALNIVCREKREEAAEVHKRFLSREGDHVTMLNVYRGFADVGKKEQVSGELAAIVDPACHAKVQLPTGRGCVSVGEVVPGQLPEHPVTAEGTGHLCTAARAPGEAGGADQVVRGGYHQPAARTRQRHLPPRGQAAGGW